MLTVDVGSLQHWRVVNPTREVQGKPHAANAGRQDGRRIRIFRIDLLSFTAALRLCIFFVASRIEESFCGERLVHFLSSHAGTIGLARAR
jgi:hypothetical protein